MFAGLVATASGQSSSGRSSASSTSSLSPEEHGYVAVGSASAERHASSFKSPSRAITADPSPRTEGRRDWAPASSEFLSPYSVSVNVDRYLSPSTGGRSRRPYVGASEHSPLMIRSWGTLSGHEEGVNEHESLGEGCVVHGVDSNNADFFQSSFSRVHKEGELDDEKDDTCAEEKEDEDVPAIMGRDNETLWKVTQEDHRVSLSPLSSSHHSFHFGSDEDTKLEKLAKQRSSSPPFSTASRSSDNSPSTHGSEMLAARDDRSFGLHDTSPGKDSNPRRNSPATPGRVFPSSQPVAASALLSTLKKANADVVGATGTLSLITPPFASVPLSSRSPDIRGADVLTADVLRERSGTLEGRTITDKSSVTSPAFSSRSSTPYIPPPDSPPDSAIKRPPGTVLVMETEEAKQTEKEAIEASTTHSVRDAPTGLTVTATITTASTATATPSFSADHHRNPHHQHGGTTLLFGVQYTEEEHRVQLEMQETEERRCLFRAYKAVLALYRMWESDDTEGNFLKLEEGTNATPRLIMGHAHAHTQTQHQPLFDRAVAESFNSSKASTAERVQRFFNTSVESARERRSGSSNAANAAEMSAWSSWGHHRATAPAITYRASSILVDEEVEDGEEERERQRYPQQQRWQRRSQVPLSSASSFSAPAPSKKRLSSSDTVPLSPPASRHLEYSSLLGPDPRASVSDSSALSSRPPRQPLKTEQLQQHHQHARLFSPWRVDRSATGFSPTNDPLTATTATATTASREASDKARESQYTRHSVNSDGSGSGRGGCCDGASSFNSLIPHIRRTSPLGRHVIPSSAALASAASARAEVTSTSAASAPSSFVSEYMTNVNTKRREEEQHSYITSPSSRLPPSSVLSNAFPSFTCLHASANKYCSFRESGSKVFTSRAAPLTSALVRSPRVALSDASLLPPPSSTRNSTPPWNTSPNLRSTAAASRLVSSSGEQRGGWVAGSGSTTTTTTSTNPFAAAVLDHSMTPEGFSEETLGFVPNNAFRQRQRAMSLSPPSRSPLNNGGFPLSSTTSIQQQMDENSRRCERLSSYVEYKRFFDSVYGADRHSPVHAKESSPHKHQQQRSSFWYLPHESARRKAASYRGGNQNVSDVSRGFDVRYTDGPGNFYGSPSAAVRTRSPDVFFRRAVLHPFSYQQPSTILSTTLSSSTSDSKRAFAVPRDMYTARLDRLCTLEKLCRAELQRRWMEDQNVLLHRFVIEGTVALQGVRAAKEAAVVTQRGRQPQVRDAVKDAGAWTFIPNEID